MPRSDFYESQAWLELRYKTLEKHKASCMCCGASGKDEQLHIDHIRPRSIYPELELDEENVQVLCRSCNIGKSNKYETDWRGGKRPTLNVGKLLAYIKSVGGNNAQEFNKQGE